MALNNEIEDLPILVQKLRRLGGRVLIGILRKPIRHIRQNCYWI